MTGAEFKQKRQQLLDKFLAGEIDKPTYDRLLTELEDVSSLDLESEDIASPGSLRHSVEETGYRPHRIDVPPAVIVSESDSLDARRHQSRPIPLPEPGTELGGFRMTRRLGRGGMGEVWLAKDIVGERDVVIKLLHPELLHRPEEMVAVKEVFQRVHALQHQHICPVYLLGQDSRYGYFIVMKYIDGVTLSLHRKSVVAKQGSFSLRELARVLGPVAKALDYAHSQHVVHRDVKPQNVMVGDDGHTVQLVDFGLSAEIRSSVHSQGIDFGGTYPYMAPEQWRCEVQDARTDQYSLAVMAYELLAGRRPFLSGDPTVLRLCALNDDPPLIDSQSAEVNAALRRGMAKSRDDRFDSCLEFVRSLCAAVLTKPSSAEVPVLGAAVPTVNSTPTPRAVATPISLTARPSQANSPNDRRRDVAMMHDDDMMDDDRDFDPQPRSPSKRPVDQGKEPRTSVIAEERAQTTIRRSPEAPANRRTNPQRADSVKKVFADDEDWDVDDDHDDEGSARRVLSDANRQATQWVMGILSALVCMAVGVFAIVYFQGGLTSTTQQQASREKANEEQVNNSNGKTVPIPLEPDSKLNPKPNPQGNALRYRWQQGRSYVYSVSVDQDQDADTVLTLQGNLTYSVYPVVAEAPGNGKTDKSTGTAFVIHPDGWLLTCHHVIDEASDIEVSLGGTTYKAKVIAADADRDSALIKIDARGLPALQIGNSEAVQVGEEVRAVGFPFSSILGDNAKTTRGTISGINMEDGQKSFQIDASINPGNSGGPLVNEQGDVIGINYAVFRGERADGVGFAVPIDDTKGMLGQHQVKYASGKSGPKLDGPALFKLVNASTALVTVKGGGTRVGERISLQMTGQLNERIWSRAGHPVDPIRQMQAGRRMAERAIRSMNGEANQVETDPRGRVHNTKGTAVLPSYLGFTSRLILETLPANARQTTWSVSTPVRFTLTEQGGDDGPFGLPRRFGPRSFGPRLPFGPFGPFDGGGGGEQKETVHLGRVRIDYVLGDKAGALQTVKKTFDLRTDDSVGAGPLIHLSGQGTFTINTETGLPQECEFAGVLVENEATVSKTQKLKLTYKLIEDVAQKELIERNAKAGIGAQPVIPNAPFKPVIPASAEEPGEPVVADSKVAVGDKLLAQWGGNWLPVKVIAIKPDGSLYIHWDGWSDTWDETMSRDRLRFPKPKPNTETKKPDTETKKPDPAAK